MSLFAATKERYRGSKELAISNPECVWCGPVSTVVSTQPALFRHGGFGGAERWTVRSCLCGAVRSESFETVNPRRL